MVTVMWLNIRIFLILTLVTALSACGGGGNSTLANKSTSSSNSSSGTTNGSTNGTISATISGTNVAPVVVDSGPAGITTVNEVFTSVTICDSASNCQTIDHILVDTGSNGLRIISSVLSPSLNLTAETDSSSNPIGACGTFVDGYTWGPVKLATVKIADETTAQMIPIQVIDSSNSFTPVPTSCSSTGTAENTVASFGANGVLGVGYFQQDCGAYCAARATKIYYSCTTTSCTQIALPTTQQITNPVTQFAVDNNGVMLSLPSLSASGGTNVAGSLVFGIGTQSNNDLGSAQVYTVDPSSGYLTTQFNGQTLINSFIDSGSNGLYFSSGTLTALTPCPSYTYFYCPSSTQNYTAVIKGANTNQTTINFSVANATSLFYTYNTAFDNLAGTGSSTSFDWGLPFFYGRKVFVAIEGQAVGVNLGPFVAF